MNSTQVVIAIGFTTLCAVSLAIAWRVIRSTSERSRGTPADLDRIRRRENQYALGIVAALVVLMGVSASAIPYGESAEPDAQVVDVSGFQFGWQLDPNRVQAERQVEFRTTSKDVQHGFGVYRGTELIAQVQVPAIRPDSGQESGEVQKLYHTFDEPGTYEILCLEFCGVNHHRMIATLEVVP